MTVISNTDRSAVRPSDPLAEKSTVLHNNPDTGEVSKWNPGADDGNGGWETIPNDQARDIVGGKPAPEGTEGDELE